jgi:hypothetical protein
MPSDLSIKEISVSEAGFIGSDPTIAVGLVDDCIAVQVLSQCVRVVRTSPNSGLSGEALQDVLVADEVEVGGLGGGVEEIIVYADICQCWVVLLTSTGSVYLLQYDREDESLVLRHSAVGRDLDIVEREDGNVEGSNGEREYNGNGGFPKLNPNSNSNSNPNTNSLNKDEEPSLDSYLTSPTTTLSLFFGHFPASYTNPNPNLNLNHNPNPLNTPITTPSLQSLTLTLSEEDIAKNNKNNVGFTSEYLVRCQQEEARMLYGSCLGVTDIGDGGDDVGDYEMNEMNPNPANGVKNGSSSDRFLSETSSLVPRHDLDSMEVIDSPSPSPNPDPDPNFNTGSTSSSSIKKNEKKTKKLKKGEKIDKKGKVGFVGEDIEEVKPNSIYLGECDGSCETPMRVKLPPVTEEKDSMYIGMCRVRIMVKVGVRVKGQDYGLNFL